MLTGIVVAVLGVVLVLPNHRFCPPVGFSEQALVSVHPDVTDCHNPLSVPPTKSSEEVPPTPTCFSNKLSPQAIVSLAATILVLHCASYIIYIC